MFVLVKVDFSIEDKSAWLFDDFEEAYNYMRKDLDMEKIESVGRWEDMIRSGIFEDDRSHAFMETDNTEITWDIIELLKK
jgi:hypothetical protein